MGRRRILGSQNGSVLIVGLVIIAVVSMVSAAALEYMTNVKAAQERAYDQSDFTGLVQQISSLLSTEVSCRRAFGGPLAYGGATFLQAQTVTPTANSSQNINIYYPVNTGSGPLTLMAGTNSNWPPTSLEAKPRLTSVNLTITPRTDLGGGYWFADLDLRAKRLNGRDIAGFRTFKLNILIDGSNRISSCLGLSFATSTGGGTGMNLPVCSGNGQALWSDGTIVKCINVTCITVYKNGWQSSCDRGSVCCEGGPPTPGTCGCP